MGSYCNNFFRESSLYKLLSTMKNYQQEREIKVNAQDEEEQLTSNLKNLLSTNTPSKNDGGDAGGDGIDRVTVRFQVPRLPITAATFTFEKDTKLRFAFRDYAKEMKMSCSCPLKFFIDQMEINEEETIAELELQNRIHIEEKTVSFVAMLKDGDWNIEGPDFEWNEGWFFGWNDEWRNV